MKQQFLYKLTNKQFHLYFVDTKNWKLIIIQITDQSMAVFPSMHTPDCVAFVRLNFRKFCGVTTVPIVNISTSSIQNLQAHL